MPDPTTNRSAWKFWRPLSLWKVLLIFFLAQIVAILLVVALRELLSLPVPAAAAGGAGGLLGVLTATNLAAKQRTRGRG